MNIIKVGSLELRNNLSEIIIDVTYRDQVVVITRVNRDMCAIVPLKMLDKITTEWVEK